jgi:hypothetical protein
MEQSISARLNGTRAAPRQCAGVRWLSGKYETGKPISGLDDAAKLEGSIFHAGTKRDAGELRLPAAASLITALGQPSGGCAGTRIRAVSRIISRSVTTGATLL